MSEIVVRNLQKSFTLRGEPLPVLKGLDLTLRRGEITVLLGKSGCGKTTLLRILAGLEMRDKGEVSVPEGHRLGVIFQEPRLMPWLDVRENILFSDAERKIPETRLQELIELVGLQGFETAKPRQLSGGMQQRAALARALAYEPEWLLMDEPFSALDYFTRRAMQQELLRVQRAEPKGIFLVTHHLDEALCLADRILLLQEGKISKTYELPAAGAGRDLLSREMITQKEEILKEMER